jgi:hypothetical protein
MLLKSLAALALAAQASALSVGLYVDSACSQQVSWMTAFNGACTQGSAGMDKFAVGTSACTGTGSAVTAKVDLYTSAWTYEPYVAPTCTGTKLKSFTATATCASLGTISLSSGTVPIYAKIDTAVDGSCGSAAAAGTAVIFSDTTCTSFLGQAFPIVADNVCRVVYGGSSSHKVREFP